MPYLKFNPSTKSTTGSNATRWGCSFCEQLSESEIDRYASTVQKQCVEYQNKHSAADYTKLKAAIGINGDLTDNKVIFFCEIKLPPTISYIKNELKGF